MGLPAFSQAAQGHPPGAQRVSAEGGDRTNATVLRSVHPRPKGQDASHRLSSPGRQSVAARLGHSHPLPRFPAGEYGRRAPGKDARLSEPGSLSPAVPHPDNGQGAGPLPFQLRQPLRYAGPGRENL